MMELNARQRLILVGVLQDQRRIAAMPWGDGHGMSRDALGRYRLRIHQAKEGLVAMNLEQWLGHAPSNSEHVLCCRECQRLEGMGLLARCNAYGGRRTTHLKLTPAGIRAAKRFLAEEYGLEANKLPLKLDDLELMPIDLSEFGIEEPTAETDAKAAVETAVQTDAPTAAEEPEPMAATAAE